MQLNLLISLGLLAVLVGCATSAPELPKDYYSVDSTIKLDDTHFSKKDLARNCKSLIDEQRDLTAAREGIDKAKQKDRLGEQIGTYVAFLTFLPAVAIAIDDGGIEEKISLIQSRYDKVNLLLSYKSCKQ